MGDFILERINSDEKIVLVQNETYTYGRDSNNEIVRISPLISRKHCVFIVTQFAVKIIDSGSSNGVYVNGTKIPPHVPTYIEIDNTIGIACGEVENFKPEDYAYRLKRSDNVVSNKRKLKTEPSKIPTKIPKTELQEIPELVILDDDDGPAKNSVPCVQIPQQAFAHTSKSCSNTNVFRIPQTKQENNFTSSHSDADIEIIDLDEVEPIQNNNISYSNSDEQIPMVQLPLDSALLCPAFVKQEVCSSTDKVSETTREDTNSFVVNPHLIKYENVLPEDRDMFADSPPPQLSTSNIKQERIHSDFDFQSNSYSQVELICLSDDEDEDFFPPSQLFDDATINYPTTCNDTVSIKQEQQMVAYEESSNAYQEPANIYEETANAYDEYDDSLVVLTDEDNDDDDEDDRKTKAWLQKLLGSQLQKQEAQEIKPQISQLNQTHNGAYENEVIEVEYGQLNDLAINEEATRSSIERHDLLNVERIVEESQEVRSGQLNGLVINERVEQTPVDRNDLIEVEEKIGVCKSNDINAEKENPVEYDKKTKSDVVDKQLKKQKKKKEKKQQNRNSSNIDNKQQHIDKSESTSCKTSNFSITEDSDSIPEKIVECHDKKLEDDLNKKKNIEHKRRTSTDKLNKDVFKENLNLCRKDSKSDKIKDKRASVDKTDIDNDEQAKYHGKEDLKEQRERDKNKRERSSDKRRSSTDNKLRAIETDTTSKRSSLPDEVNENFENNAVQKNFSEQLLNIEKSLNPDRWIKTSNKKEKKITQVDAPFLPKGERRGVSINITSSSSGTLRDNSGSSDDDFTVNKISFFKQQDKEEKSVNDHSNNKNTKLKRVKKKLKNSSAVIDKIVHSNEKKREIKKQRNERLKQLSGKSDSMKKPEDNSNVKRINKPRVKVSEKNRGAFLTENAEENSSDNDIDNNSGENVESLIMSKSQELQQNTAAMDLSDVISGSSSHISTAKSKRIEHKPKTVKKDKKNKLNQINKNKTMSHNKNDQENNYNNNNQDNHNNNNNNNNNSNNNINKPSIRNSVRTDLSIRLINLNLPNENNKNQVRQKSSKKKKVTFNTKTTIHQYFIDEGNTLTRRGKKDMGIGTQCSNYDLKPKIECPKRELFFSHIFNWMPVWLNEQQKNSHPPPIVNAGDILPAAMTYKTYKDYYKVMSTLMLLETWYIMSKGYDNTSNRSSVFFSSVVEESVSEMIVDSSSNVKLTIFMLEILVNEQVFRQRAHPVDGDLVMVELTGVENGKKKVVHVFAYINELNNTTITSSTRYNIALNRVISKPHTLITYTMMTRTLPISLRNQKLGRLKTVTYLRSHMRMVQGLQYLPQSPLVEAILHPTAEAYKLPIVSNYETQALITRDNLNKKQRESVFRITEAIIDQKPGIFLIQGPPGTGKSKVIINLITEILYGNKQKENKILVCAPSNAAVDELNSRLLGVRKTLEDRGHRIKMVRIGRQEAIAPTIKSIHVTELAKRDVEKTLAEFRPTRFNIEFIEKQKECTLARINMLKKELHSEGVSEGDKQNLLRKIASSRAKHELLHSNPVLPLDSKLHTRLRQAAENNILAGANIITCTLSSCFTGQMESIIGKNDEKISVCIVDEATQSSEPETLIPLMLGVKSLILVGDPNQLPATVISQQAKKLGFDKSLFARIQSVFNGSRYDPVLLLDTQYRMSRPIALFPNRYFYKNVIQNVPHTDRLPFQFYKVFNLSSRQDHGNKFVNTDEAIFVANLLYTMMTYADLKKVEKLRIGIITPYNHQRMLIIQKLNDRMENVPEEIKKKVITEVNTIDSFQGQERDVVIISCVRSSGIGFLSDPQRVCVALTRAKYSLILCGNFQTFEKDSMWFELLKDARDRNICINLDYKAEPETIKEYIVR